MKPLDLHGQTFHRLTILHRAEQKPDGARWWVCRCDCGEVRSFRGADLKRGFVKSCGCWNREVTVRRSLSHGLSATRLYRIWQAMRNRTSNPKAEKFGYYGGRGISVCEEWGRFEPFHEWAVANGYEDRPHHPRSKHLTIDRIDPDGDYEPSNCRWVEQLEQVRNQRPKKTAKITAAEALEIRSDNRTGREIALHYGISQSSVSAIKTRKNWANI